MVDSESLDEFLKYKYCLDSPLNAVLLQLSLPVFKSLHLK